MSKKYLTIEELKRLELEILIYIHTFCVKNNIKYFINYGTLLGAVRHKGFIPWDDDIDISMNREDYNKFIKLFSKDTGIYKIISMDNNNKYYNNFIKVINTKTKIEDGKNYKTYDCGVFIDIFPCDRFNNLNILKKVYILESFKLLSISKKKYIQYGDSKLKDFIRLVFWALLKPISPRFFALKIKKLLSKSIDKNGKFIGFLADKFSDKEIFKYNMFDEIIKMDFENYTFFAPKNYNEILTQYYGNYMELPPIEKQINPHEIKAYFID